MRKRIRSATILTFLGVFFGLSYGDLALLAQAVVQESRGPLAIETITFGLESAYPCHMPTLLVIRDQEDWQVVWGLHQGRKASQNQPPDIDFEQFSVIALFAGRRPSTEGVQIVRCEHPQEGALVVYAVELEPGLGCIASRISKNPFHMVRIPAAKKHAAASLEIELLSRQCTDRDGLPSPR
ncbi:MAG TPA: hypothetical protein DCR97_09030 [Deltaproteobacteria bacterium]|nr:hypothetical protein [Deltaproteobacteria bacterium]